MTANLQPALHRAHLALNECNPRPLSSTVTASPGRSGLDTGGLPMEATTSEPITSSRCSARSRSSTKE